MILEILKRPLPKQGSFTLHHMKLELQRPLAVFDLETTGVRIGRDRIVQIAIVKLMPDGSRETYCELINPEMPIPADSTAIHGITDADVADKPTLQQRADEILDVLRDCDLAGFNCARFDVPMLREELFSVGRQLDIDGIKVVDAQRIYHKMEPRNLSAALKFYTGQDHETAHDALGDVQATIDVLLGQLDKYDELPVNTEELSDFCDTAKHMRPDPSGKLVFDDLGRICCGFGKHAGKPIKELALYDQGYVKWMLNKADLPAGTIAMIKQELQGIEQ